MIRCSDSSRIKRFSLFPSDQPVPEAHPVINGYRGFFPGVKRPESKNNHSSPSSVEFKNE
jgi:hypothetical protein